MNLRWYKTLLSFPASTEMQGLYKKNVLYDCVHFNIYDEINGNNLAIPFKVSFVSHRQL